MSSTSLTTKMANASGWPLWHVGELDNTPAFLAELPLDPQQLFLAATITDWNKTAVEQAVRRAGFSAPSLVFNPLAEREDLSVLLAFMPPADCIGPDRKPSLTQLATLMECTEPKNALGELFNKLVLPLNPGRLLSYTAYANLEETPNYTKYMPLFEFSACFFSYPTCAEMLADKKLPPDARATACRIIPALAYKPAPRIR